MQHADMCNAMSALLQPGPGLRNKTPHRVSRNSENRQTQQHTNDYKKEKESGDKSGGSNNQCQHHAQRIRQRPSSTRRLN